MNVFQLQRTSLQLYFAVAIPLLALIILILVLLKTGILYSQSGETNLNFFRWILAGRPKKHRIAKLDLEKGGLTEKLRDRLRGTGQAPENELPLGKGKAKSNKRGKKQE